MKIVSGKKKGPTKAWSKGREEIKRGD